MNHPRRNNRWAHLCVYLISLFCHVICSYMMKWSKVSISCVCFHCVVVRVPSLSGHRKWSQLFFFFRISVDDGRRIPPLEKRGSRPGRVIGEGRNWGRLFPGTSRFSRSFWRLSFFSFYSFLFIFLYPPPFFFYSGSKSKCWVSFSFSFFFSFFFLNRNTHFPVLRMWRSSISPGCPFSSWRHISAFSTSAV